MKNMNHGQEEYCRDLFLLIAERPDLYQTAARCENAINELQHRYANATPHVKARVGLAIAYAKRVHSDESVPVLLQKIRDLEALDPTDVELSRISRLVQAVILLTCAEDYSGGLVLLDELHHELRYTETGPLYGLVRRWMGYAYMGLARPCEAQVAFQDAVSVCRRYGMKFTHAAALNDYAVLRKRCGQYLEASAMLREVIREFVELGATRNVLFAIVNQGVLSMRIGDWHAAERHFCRASEDLARDGVEESGNLDSQLRSLCTTNIEHLLLLKRAFGIAEQRLLAVVEGEAIRSSMPRVLALTREFLGELYTETERYEEAAHNLEVARSIADRMFPESDLVSEITRREAQLHLALGNVQAARESAKRCIRLSLKTSDRYELGSALRVLGEVYVAVRDKKRALACFGSAVQTLKGIHECYELMRTLYAQGPLLAQIGKHDEAEIALLEARQLAKKLELDYYQALIAIALMDILGSQERFNEANTWLAEAMTLRDGLEGIDRKRVDTGLKRAAGDLQSAMTRSSVRAAEDLKTICRVYEDARFPIEELKPDLAYQVAQSVGSECLFVVCRHGGGYQVPLTYNIAVNDAKGVVRDLTRGMRKGTLLGLDGEPKVLRTSDDRTVVAVPCHHVSGARRLITDYVLCVRFDGIIAITPRQLELLCASAEALARLIEGEDERRAKSAGEGEDEPVRIKHPRGSFKDILTIDPEMIKVIRTAERAATSVAPILLEGETGVGKELFARAIHGSSRRKEEAFVAVNAGGLSVHLVESELFGHVKGSFTGANNDRVGLIETARGGTLFLDEIGEMGEELQVKLLRLLENGEYRRLGESVTRQADVRIITATNRDLKKEVDRSTFRRDLYYRISPIRLTIPPLRLRTGDIQLIVRHFLRDCAALNGIADRYIEIDVKAMEALELYDWPGNVRELYNEILRVVSLIGKGDLVRFAMLSDNIKDYLKSKNRGDGLLDRSVEQFERRLILNALDRNDWNRMRTADSIGVPRTTLLAKLKRLNVASK